MQCSIQALDNSSTSRCDIATPSPEHSVLQVLGHGRHIDEARKEVSAKVAVERDVVREEVAVAVAVERDVVREEVAVATAD